MQIEFVASIDSTNSELMRRAQAGDYTSCCLVAQLQTAGRGRLGRAWLSDAHSLTFSLGLPLAPVNWSGLSLAVGVSIAKNLHPNIQIKWPNDLWVSGKKLAGILIETASIAGAAPQQRYAVIGVGLNLEAPIAAAWQASQDGKAAPAGLRELAPKITSETALQSIAEPLLEDIHLFAQQGFAPFAAEFSKRDALAGLSIHLSNGASGKYAGVNAQGALQLDTNSGTHTIISHEVSVCF